MMEARRIGGFRHVHTEINGVDHHLQYGGNNATAARTAGHQPGFPLFHHDSRRHRRQRTFFRPDGVGIAAHQPVDIRHARFRREVIHLVVHQYPGATRHNTGPEGSIQRIGDRHRVTLFIHHREMGGLVTFIRRQFARTNLARRFGFVDINLFSNRFGVGFVGERLPRYFDKVRIAEILRAVGIGMLFSFRHDLHGVCTAEAIFMHVEVFEDIEDLYDVDPPG